MKDGEDLRTQIAELEKPHRLELLRIGAAGQLHMAGKLKVLPAEDEAAHNVANPFKPSGGGV